MSKIAATGVLALFAMFGAAACEASGETELETTPGAETPATDPAIGAPEPGERGDAALAVATLEGAGAYLTDGSGRALYLLEQEPPDSSICYDECAGEWPPFLAEQGRPDAAAADIQQDLIGTIQRRDGTTQVTYAGHPLYYYHDDEGPGDTEGQDVRDAWGEWYLVQPSGEPLEEHGEHG